MNRKQLCLHVLFIALGLPLFSQLNSFNLSDYKLPNLKRHILETNLDLNGFNYFGNQPNNSGSSSIKDKSNSYFGSFRLGYNGYVTNEKRQLEISSIVSVQADYYNSKENGNLTSKNNSVRPAFYNTFFHRWYFKPGIFMETDQLFTYALQNTNYSTYSYGYNQNEISQHQQNINIYLPLKIGKGRIEQVEDARQAVYLFDELKKAGRLSSDKTPEEIIEFARFISELKNKRFFDSRIQKIYELEAIDSFLNVHHDISKADARYFATVNDFWAFGNTPVRRSGFRLSAAIYPGYNRYSYKNLALNSYYQDNDYSLTNYSIHAGLELVNERPLNLFWQYSTTLSFFAGTMKADYSGRNDNGFYYYSTKYSCHVPDLQFNLNHKTGFYPSTRTSLEHIAGLNYVNLFGDKNSNSSTISEKGYGIRLYSDIELDYYISPKLRLNISSILSYTRQDTKNHCNVNFDNLIGSNFGVMSLVNNFSAYNNPYSDKIFTHQFYVSVRYSIF